MSTSNRGGILNISIGPVASLSRLRAQPPTVSHQLIDHEERSSSHPYA